MARYLQEAQDWMKELTSTQRREYWHVIQVARAGLALVIYYSELALAVYCNVWDPWHWADREVQLPQQANANKEMILPHITCREDILCRRLIHSRNAQTATSTFHISSYCCAEGMALADCTLTFPGRQLGAHNKWLESHWYDNERGDIYRNQMILATTRKIEY